MDQSNSLQDRIPSDLSDRISREFTHKLSTDELRNKVKEIVNDCVESVPFMRKIKEYAGEEIDERIYKNVGFWTKTIFIPIGVTVATAFILKYLKVT